MVKKVKITLIVILFFCLFLLYSLVKTVSTNTELEKNSSKQRVILLGIDGGEWDVIDPLIKEGKLSNFKKMIQEGSFGYLISPFCRSPITWTEIATGKTKEKHGIYDWGPENTGLKQEFLTSQDVKAKRVWNILGDYGKTVGVYYYLLTWPPEKVNGFMISDYLNQDKNIVYPSSLNQEIKDRFPEEEHYNDFIPEISLYLFKKYNLDFFTNVYYETDSAGHLLWKYWKPEEFNFTNQKEIEQNRGVIARIYQKADDFINMFLRENENLTFIIVSDHGMIAKKPPFYEPNFNSLLMEMYLLNYSNPDRWEEMISVENNSKIYQCGYVVFNDYSYKTKFCFLNNTNKEEIVELLLKIRVLGSNKPFFTEIKFLDGNEIELEFALNKNYVRYLNYPLILPNSKVFYLNLQREVSGDHPLGTNGIIIARGPFIKQNYNIKNATVYDITPTILYLYNIPIPRDMDGRVLTEIIKDDYLKSHPIKYTDKSSQWERQKEEIEVNQTLVQRIYEKLRSLGYII